MKALFIYLLLLTKIIAEGCMLNSEACKCNSSSPYIQIQCLTKSNYKVLNLNKLNFSSNASLLLISIQNKMIESIEPITITDIIELDISNCLLQNITNKPFRNLKKLERLRLYSNQIEFIEEGSFENLISLQKIWLYSNKLTYIKNGTFAGLVNLTMLVLRTNEIEYIEAGAFQSFKNISEIWLYSNRIKRFDRNLFANLFTLKFLFLNSMNIEEVEPFSFIDLKNLTTLALYSNNIKCIKKNTYNYLANLESLSADSNEIEYIEEFSLDGLKRLKILFLFSNKLKQVEQYTFFGLENLEILRLHSNGIETIHKYSFIHFKKVNNITLDLNRLRQLDIRLNSANLNLMTVSSNQLEYSGLEEESAFIIGKNLTLDLTNNAYTSLNNLKKVLKFVMNLNMTSNKIYQIDAHTFNESKNLFNLNLSYNIIRKLEKNSFAGLKNLRELDLSFNKIQSLFTDMFVFMENLVKLYLNNNQIKFIESFSFRNLKSLMYLSLSSNSLHDFSKINVFNGLESLNYLFISKNQIEEINQNSFNIEVLTELTHLDLSWNKIKSFDYEFSENKKLKSIDLIGNQIDFLSKESFMNLNLTQLSLSDLNIESFDIRNYLIQRQFELIELLDLSRSDLIINQTHLQLQSLRVLKLEKIGLTNLSQISTLLNTNLTELDLSHNQFVYDLDTKQLFEKMSNLITLRLKNTSMKSIQEVNVSIFTNLTQLDLSYNNLKHIKYATFLSLGKLEYLDLSFNSIYLIEEKSFANNILLRYLNLQDNNISTIGVSYQDYFNLETLNLAGNQLLHLPFFRFKVSATKQDSLTYFYFQRNKLSVLNHSLTINPNHLLRLDIEFNEISQITENSFSQSKLLVYISLSHNKLKVITEKLFDGLYDLKYLNLSNNLIEIIEKNAFVCMNKLILLNLSSNLLRIISKNELNGLTDLRDIYLFNMELEFKRYVFDSTVSLKNIFLNKSIITNNMSNLCILKESLARKMIGKFAFCIYYSSINLITESNFNSDHREHYCDLTIFLIQFNIHLNFQNDQNMKSFYDYCASESIMDNNSFQKSYFKCSPFDFSLGYSYVETGY